MSRRESISQNKEHKKEHNKVGTWVTAAGVRPRKGKESTTLFLLTRDTNVLKCILHCRYGGSEERSIPMNSFETTALKLSF